MEDTVGNLCRGGPEDTILRRRVPLTQEFDESVSVSGSDGEGWTQRGGEGRTGEVRSHGRGEVTETHDPFVSLKRKGQ